MNRFAQRLESTRPIILDGGLATEIEGAGHALHETLWSAGLLITDRQAIGEAHGRFAQAGAEIIATASYQGSRAGFMGAGLSAREADELMIGSVALAREAARAAGRPDTLIAASLGPWGAVQADGSEYTGNYRIEREDLHRFHQDRLMLMDRAQADVLALETIPNLQEAQVLADALAAVNTPAWVSFCCRDEASLSDGTPLESAARLFRKHPRVLALGVNCTAPANLPGLIRRLKATVPELPCFVYPNSGEHYDARTRRWTGEVSVSSAGEAATGWVGLGARAVGGCCRMTAAHISAMARALQATEEQEP